MLIFAKIIYKKQNTMEKEALVEELKNRVGENDFGVLSGQTVDALVATFLPSFADDDKVTDDTWKLPVEVVKNYAGQYRHDLATKTAEEKTRLAKENESAAKALAEKQIAEFKAEWDKTHQTNPANGKKDDGEEKSAVEKALEAYNIKLFGEDGKGGLIGGKLNETSDFIASSKKAIEAEKISNIKKQLKDYLVEERKASRDAVVNLSIKELEVVSDSDIDELKIKVEKIYEERYKDFYGDSGKPFGGDSAGGTGNGGGSDEVTEYLKKRGEAAAKQAELTAKTKSLLR
ncbi:hypothetical protein C7120_08870 [Prevotella sp. oral taxon 376]|nr:hypothetical protein C7120_08870 [Prevotella sp. oral taxon 376]